MKTAYGHLTYCTNIHAGENWDDHFNALKANVPAIRASLASGQPFSIGLRLSHIASQELGRPERLEEFKTWLRDEGCYVGVINGFPYGGFHHTRVKDQVHAPDWTTQDRVIYTVQLFRILASLLPDDLEGGVSTSPLSYKLWHNRGLEEQRDAVEIATENILKVLQNLIDIRETTGKLMHLDVEPEPDGILGNGVEFISWYRDQLIPRGLAYLSAHLGYKEEDGLRAIKQHIRICYDICHFAVGYEDHARRLAELDALGIRIGRFQVSAALKADIAPNPIDREMTIRAFRAFDESTYLHQVVARQDDGTLLSYPDLPEALKDAHNIGTREWRSHFHVPLFISDYGVLKSTQDDILKVLALYRENPRTPWLEVETYTWEVLPESMRLPIRESIVRELRWVLDVLDN